MKMNVVEEVVCVQYSWCQNEFVVTQDCARMFTCGCIWVHMGAFWGPIATTLSQSYGHPTTNQSHQVDPSHHMQLAGGSNVNN